MDSARLRRDLLIAVFALIAFLAFIPIFTYAYFASDLTTEIRLMSHNDRGVTLLDRHGTPFFEFYQAKVYNGSVPLADIPLETQYAIISAEDKDFYSHEGFSIKAIVRSFLANILKKDLFYGASTITQQLVKNTLLTPTKSFLRKYQEVVLAAEVERRYTKDQILEMYLSSAYFGEGALGINEAAEVYFGKNVKNLSLAESSMLAGLLPAPSRLSPISGDLEEAKKRQKLVLEKMVEQKYITKDQADEALKTKLTFNDSTSNMNNLAPHFALMVRDELIKRYGEEELVVSGFRVRTTIDLNYQKYAENVVQKQVKNLAGNLVENGAAVVEDPKTGEILALVGSKDWHNNQFGKVNIPLSKRQTGSAFKPIVYVAAFEKRLITPATILQDRPTAFRNDPNLKATGPNAFYSPVNYDRKFRGPVTVRRALSNSLNVPAVSVMSKVGVPTALEMAKRLGITTLDGPEHYGLALVLGVGDVKLLELTNVYATFANSGYKNDPAIILEVDDKNGNAIYTYSAAPKKVLDERDVFEITSILSDNSARQEAFGNALNISRPAAVKTGTTDDWKDAWTLGYTPSLVIGVWVGNNEGRSMDQVAGSLGAAPIWKELMEKFSAGKPVENFKPPPGMIPMTVCPDGSVAEATPGAKAEYFIPGTEPKQKCNKPSARPSASPMPSPSSQVSPQPQSSPSVSPSPSPSPSAPSSNTPSFPPGTIRQTFDPATGIVYYQIFI